MEHHYKSHTIVITTWGNLDGFTSEFRINKKSPVVFETLKLNQPFPTKAEAENYALEFAQKWINDSKPDQVKNYLKTMPAHNAYKSHLIASSPWLDPETKRWTPNVSIICPPEEAGTHLINRPVFKISFASEQQAQSEGVVFAQKWIDDGKPDLPQK